MNKKTKIIIQNTQKPRYQTNLFYQGRDAFQNFKKYMIDNFCADDKLNYIFVIGDQKYLLENQKDYEEIKKLNETQDGYLEISDKKINQQFENRKQIHQNQQINQQKENIKEENFETQQFQENNDYYFKDERREEDIKDIYSTPSKQFFSHKYILKCPCSSEKKQENCLFCNNQRNIQYEQYQEELDQAMKDFLIHNLGKLQQFIIDKFNLKEDQMNSYFQWISFHNELMNFENLKNFNFQCIKCKLGFSKENVVYVKQQKFPQSPVCANCYNHLNKEEQNKYFCLEYLREVQLSKPPNIMERNNSQGI